jgi:hypothetical protein
MKHKINSFSPQRGLATLSFLATGHFSNIHLTRGRGSAAATMSADGHVNLANTMAPV